jgi:hypothetical protein
MRSLMQHTTIAHNKYQMFKVVIRVLFDLGSASDSHRHCSLILASFGPHCQIHLSFSKDIYHQTVLKSSFNYYCHLSEDSSSFKVFFITAKLYLWEHMGLTRIKVFFKDTTLGLPARLRASTAPVKCTATAQGKYNFQVAFHDIISPSSFAGI